MKVTAFLTDGFETVEALAVIDILRRADIEVQTVSITGDYKVKSAQNIYVYADKLFDEAEVSAEDVLFYREDLDTSHIWSHRSFLIC